jgi:hypothetical protein
MSVGSSVAIDPYRTAIPCQPPCEWRLRAVIDEVFLPAKTLGGWIWTEVPLRQAAWRRDKGAAFRASYYGVPDHTGEPMVFTSCPGCGGELPVPLEDDWSIDGETGG